MVNIYLPTTYISNFAKLDFDIENIFALLIVFGDFYLLTLSFTQKGAF